MPCRKDFGPSQKILVLVLLAAVAPVSVPSTAEPRPEAPAPHAPGTVTAPAEPKPPARREWRLRLGLDQRYDDNILQLSDRDLDRLDSPSANDVAANRFSIESADDFITVPRVSPGFKADWWHGRPTSFDLDVWSYTYLDASIKDYRSYRFSAAQTLRGGKALATRAGLTYGLLPRYYLRNLISDRYLEELGFLPSPLPRREVTFRKSYAQIDMEQDLVRDLLTLRGSWGSERRDYNRWFDERDSRMPYFEAGLALTPRRDGRLRFRASYRREDLHAEGDLSDTPSFIESDISSRRHIVEADLRLRWGVKGRRQSLAIDHEYERRDYSTTNSFDAFHFGREDTRHYTTLSFRADLKKGWFLAAQAEHDTNRSRFPAATGGTSDPNDVTDYTENLAQFGFGYEFGAAPTRAGRAGAPTD
jgi:hypothetical protein